MLHILKKAPGPEVLSLIDGHKKTHEVTVIDLRLPFSPEEVLKRVEEAEKVFCW